MVGQVLAWSVIAAVVVVLAVAVVVPRVAGATPYTVLTGSMQPGLPPGSLVVVRPVDPDDITTGDVITYQLQSGEPTMVTHRVISTGLRTDGERVLRTQGDANNVPDREPVRDVQVQGRLWYAVPHLGHLNTWISSNIRQVVTTGVVAALAIYAAWMFGSAAVDRRRNHDQKKGAHAA